MLDQNIQWMAFAGKIILHAAQHQRAAMALARGANLPDIEPHRAHDADIKRAISLVLAQISAKRKPQVGNAGSGCRIRLAPAIDPDQFAWLKTPRRFLQHLAPAPLHQRLVQFQMPGRLVEQDAPVILFLYQKKLSAALDYSSDGDARARIHGQRLLPRMKAAMRATPSSIAWLDAA